MNWHQLSTEKILELTGSRPSGLSAEEARLRLEKYGANELETRKKKTFITLLLHQFRDLMILILLGASIISGFIGEWTDTLVILAILFMNAVIGLIQEYRADRALEALRKISVTQARVLRQGISSWEPAARLVPGDIVLLESGQAVPADLRLLEAVNLQIDESSLTGESLPIEKTTAPLLQDALPLGDRSNLAFRGTFVTYGRGTGLVVATGMQTELGRIAYMLSGKEEPTPLQIRLAAFGKKLAAFILILCLLFFLISWWRGEDPMRMLLTSISLAVAAIPEALPAVITISLALAARRLVKSHSLVRNLHAVETLGSVTYICTDKTGTITLNRMEAESLYAGQYLYEKNDLSKEIAAEPSTLQILRFCALNNDAVLDENGEASGDPTERALLELALRYGFEPGFLPRLAEIPFEGSRKMMTTFHPWEGKFISVTKGAPEILFSRCNGSSFDEASRVLSQMTARGERVLGFAWRLWETIPSRLSSDKVENELAFAGMVGIMDPARVEVLPAVKECTEAGIVPVIITGDHPGTARYIAQKTGILRPGEDLMVTGRELADLGEKDFEKVVERIRVYARVSPEQKLRIVRALQAKGHFVAMAGDGINDAPSIRKANIGIAMGITGTDVAKEASDLILLDDNFASIVKAVREGRRIYDNILKFIKYLMTTNSSEIWTLMVAPLLGLPIPLLPIHILWINLVSDGLPAVSLSFEKADPDIMRRTPRPPSQSVFAEGRAYHIVWVGLLMAAIVLATQALAISKGWHWQTMTFTVLSFNQLVHLMVVRSDTHSLYRIGLFSNPVLLGSFLLSSLLQLSAVYLPWLNELFRTEALNLTEIMVCMVGPALVFLSVETEKWIKRRRLRSAG